MLMHPHTIPKHLHPKKARLFTLVDDVLLFMNTKLDRQQRVVVPELN